MQGGIQINAARAPWVMFERRAEENREASIQEGRYVAKDVDYVLITPHGSKDQVERVVSEWFEYMEQQVREERFEQDWLTKFKAAYANWKTGKEVPVEGTPIINWPLISPAQVRMLQDLHILTVEILSQANEETIRRLGMGGRNLVNKAQEFLKQQKEGRSAEEVVALKSAIEGLKAVVETQAQQIATLLAQLQSPQVPQGGPEATIQLEVAGIGASDLLDSPKIAGAPPAVKKL